MKQLVIIHLLMSIPFISWGFDESLQKDVIVFEGFDNGNHITLELYDGNPYNDRLDLDNWNWDVFNLMYANESDTITISGRYTKSGNDLVFCEIDRGNRERITLDADNSVFFKPSMMISETEEPSIEKKETLDWDYEFYVVGRILEVENKQRNSPPFPEFTFKAYDHNGNILCSKAGIMASTYPEETKELLIKTRDGVALRYRIDKPEITGKIFLDMVDNMAITNNVWQFDGNDAIIALDHENNPKFTLQKVNEIKFIRVLN